MRASHSSDPCRPALRVAAFEQLIRKLSLLLRPPTDLRGIPAACVRLTSHGAAGMGCLPRTAYDGPRGAARLSPGDERNTAITFDILQAAGTDITGAAAFKAEESKMSDTVLQIMQPTNPVEPPYQYIMIDGCKVKVNYLPKPSAPSAGKVLDRIHEILLASRLKK